MPIDLDASGTISRDVFIVAYNFILSFPEATDFVIRSYLFLAYPFFKHCFQRGQKGARIRPLDLRGGAVFDTLTTHLQLSLFFFLK